MYRLLLTFHFTLCACFFATVSHGLPTNATTRTATEAYVTNRVAQGLAAHTTNATAHAALFDGKLSTSDATYTVTVARAASAYGWGDHNTAGYFGAAGGELSENATWVLRDLYLYTTYSVSGVALSSPPFGISATLNYPQDETGTVTFASREWTRSYVSTGAPPASAGVPEVWTNMTWGATGTNATYRMSWDVTNGTFKVEEILP